MPPSLLIVDDEEPQMRALCGTLEFEGYRTAGYTSARAALAALAAQPFDLVLTDLMMPEMDGIAFLSAAFAIDPDLVGIVMTGHGTIDTAVGALQAGALDYILKPFRLSAVLPVLSRALAVRQLRRENIQLREMVAIHELSLAIPFASGLAATCGRVVQAATAHNQGRPAAVYLPGASAGLLERGPTVSGAPTALPATLPLTPPADAWTAAATAYLAAPPPAAEPAAVLACPGLPGALSVPLHSAGRLAGILALETPASARPLGPGQLKSLQILASTAAAALAAASLLDALRAAEERYRHLAENAPDLVFRYELSPPSFSFLNPAVTRLTGYPPSAFYDDPGLLVSLAQPEDRPALAALLAGRTEAESTLLLRWTHREGQLRWAELRAVTQCDPSGRPVSVEGIVRDVTERIQLEEQLRHAQKLETVGRLTASVAHDFNNLLTVINGYADLLIADTQLLPRTHQRAEEVRRAGEQAAALTRRLLAFGRKQTSQPVIVNLNSLIEGSANLLGRLLGDPIPLKLSLDPALPFIRADAGQIEQILMNLAVNARDAMPAGGQLTISTRLAEFAVPRLLPAGPLAPGAYAVLTVRDTGTGIPPEVQARMFEPFFTTKESGRGTGLGLSIVDGIARQSGGSIEVESTPGRGTAFHIYLPRAVAPAPAAPPPPPALAASGQQTVLLVEDESSVRLLVTAILQGAGYRVVATPHAEEALGLFDRDPAAYSLVLTDLDMPGMSGLELIAALEKNHPALRVIYTSGDGGSVGTAGPAGRRHPFLQKPFRPDRLLALVRQVLEGPPPAPMPGS